MGSHGGESQSAWSFSGCTSWCAESSTVGAPSGPAFGLVGGAVFNHYIMFPWMMAFFAGFNTQDLVFMPKLDSVFSLYTKFLIAMAVVFQMPTLVFFLAKMKVITARFLIAQFKYAVLLIFIISAVITPTGDPVTQTVFAAPMIGLYVLGIAIAWVVGPKRLPE